jgi:hypothetical protein
MTVKQPRAPFFGEAFAHTCWIASSLALLAMTVKQPSAPFFDEGFAHTCWIASSLTLLAMTGLNRRKCSLP